MTQSPQRIFVAMLATFLAHSPQLAWMQAVSSTPAAEVSLQPSLALQPLLAFKAADIKFSLPKLMALLRDRDHEGWVLAAYPDPNTGHPLIGAGFSLDVAATDHLQHDPLNPNEFIEPSSAQLWQAAGLRHEQLQQLLDSFNTNLQAWGTKLYRKKAQRRTLPPQLTEEQATQLLRISAIQAAHNARAYCRSFDRLNGPAQMALTQLVFQMGVNLEQFVEFLSELNGDTQHRDLSLPENGAVTDAEHWKNVQGTLIDSQWARRYTTRAATVIAMFDPNYGKNPHAAEARVMAILRPPAEHRHKKPAAHKPAKTKTRR